jgi:hypothetical protein
MNAKDKLLLLVFPERVPSVIINPFLDGTLALWVVFGDLPLNVVCPLITVLRDFAKVNEGTRLSAEAEEEFFKEFFDLPQVKEILVKNLIIRSSTK